MKTLRILVILYIILISGTESAQAQLVQKMSYQELSAIGSITNAKPDTTFGSLNSSDFFMGTDCLPYWMKLTNKMNVPFYFANYNSYDLLYKPISGNGTNSKLSGKPGYITGDETGGNFNGKWERLTGKPILDTTTVIFYPLQRTNTPSLSNSRLYRTSANIFNMTMSTIYPRAYTPQKYPEANHLPK